MEITQTQQKPELKAELVQKKKVSIETWNWYLSIVILILSIASLVILSINLYFSIKNNHRIVDGINNSKHEHNLISSNEEGIEDKKEEKA